MKIFLMIVFSMFSFLASAQEKEKKSANSEKSTVKKTNNAVNVSRNENIKVSPEEFYIINDKPVDRVTYLKYLKANKK